MQITRSFFQPQNMMDAKFTGTFFYLNGQLYGSRLLDAVSIDTLQDKLRDFGCFNETTTRYDNYFADLKLQNVIEDVPDVLNDDASFPPLERKLSAGSLIPSRKPTTPKKKEEITPEVNQWQLVQKSKKQSPPEKPPQFKAPLAETTVQASEASFQSTSTTKTTMSVRGKENIKAKLREMKAKKLAKSNNS